METQSLTFSTLFHFKFTWIMYPLFVVCFYPLRHLSYTCLAIVLGEVSHSLEVFHKCLKLQGVAQW